ncbi:MAG: hypothetical protein EAZ31_07620 [Cytophagia bacterium]|nr:MAG: hypothetical protein EAY69_07420 [Cytophagales bacterium]TAG41421.1 MAG: hypothetical protein EAZ31_07620 [Cytophagia bacterium]
MQIFRGFFLKKIIFLLFFYFFSVLQAESIFSLKEKAELSFQRKEYTKCLQLYEKIFYQEKKITPQMLLQIAFIYEGLGEYTKSLYFLSLYYYYLPDPSVLTQMSTLAERYKLKGYEHSDTEAMQTFYQQYYFSITFFLIGVTLYGFIYFILRQIKKRPVPAPRKIAFLLGLGLIWWFFSLYSYQKQGIISMDNTFMMSAPSAGSELVGVINKGHKVNIKQNIDIWYLIEWNGQSVYVRKTQILDIPYEKQ